MASRAAATPIGTHAGLPTMPQRWPLSLKNNNNKHCWWHRGRGACVHHWWELIHPLRKNHRSLLKKLQLEPLYKPSQLSSRGIIIRILKSYMSLRSKCPPKSMYWNLTLSVVALRAEGKGLSSEDWRNQPGLHASLFPHVRTQHLPSFGPSCFVQNVQTIGNNSVLCM